MAKRLDDIELRSKEVQDLLGKVPSWLIRNGIVMMLFLLVMLLIGSWFFKYPDVVQAKVVVVANADFPAIYTGHVELKTDAWKKVKVGQAVNLKFFNYPYLEFGSVKGIVGKISALPTGDYYSLEVNLPGKMVSTFGKKLEFEHELKGTAEIIMEEQRLLDRLLKPLRRLFMERSR